MLLVLRRSAAQEAELQQLLADLQDKNSASYHKWLTPAQYAERFGVSAADAQTLSAWLESHGFTVNKVGAGRTSIEFSGTVGQLQSAFHTAIHRYSIGGEEHLANTSDPAIPAALAPVVSGIIGLNDFFPSIAKAATSQTAAPRASYNKQTHAARPEFTTAAGGNLLYVGPADAATIYDTPNSFNANFKGGQSYTGAGVTIAVVGDANINVADVAN
jgi:subtilase family serine protease